jgi:hypothetical protein
MPHNIGWQTWQSIMTITFESYVAAASSAPLPFAAVAE